MRERIERLGGTITIDSEPSSGTDVGIRVRTRDYDAELDAETPAVQDA
jgi:signal transduction histidine kinase